jgi:N-acetylglucosaminyl-diphospho-decaprenol L-rhamnosyltransferase
MSDAGIVVDVIVLDVDGGPMLRDCLASIAAQTLPPRRVIVFDNGSRTPTVGAIRSEVNLGFAGGMNAALQHSDAPFVALVNNDVVLDADWLATVVEAMRGDDKLAAVQTVIRRDADTVDGAGIDVSDGTIRQIGHGLPLTTAHPPAWGVSATAALYRRAAIGPRPFDERFFAYYEDVELSARLREGGWKLSVLPVAKATHRGSQSAAVLGGRALFLRTRNRYWVARLHPGTARIGALLREDFGLSLRGRSSLRGIVAGMFVRIGV